MTTTLTKRSQHFRTSALRGQSTLGVDRQAEVIRGVAVLELGDLVEGDGRKMYVDETTFSQFIQHTSTASRGLKGRFTHPDMSNDGLGSFIGRWQNPVVDGDKLRCDLHLSPRSHDSPTLGDVGKYVLDLAESDPDTFGASMHCAFDEAAMKRDRRGDGFEPIRMKSLRGIDVVDTPAATHGGLFSTTDGVPDLLSRLLDSQFAGASRDELRDRAGAYLDRYLNNRFGAIEIMTNEANNTPAAGITKADLETILATFGTSLLSKVDEKLAALKPGDEKPSDVEVERTRCRELFATAKNLGLNDWEKVATESIEKGHTVETFKASITDRLIAQNGLTRDTGEESSDPDAKYKKEFAAQRASFKAMGLSEAEYILSRKIDDGAEELVAGSAAA